MGNRIKGKSSGKRKKPYTSPASIVVDRETTVIEDYIDILKKYSHRNGSQIRKNHDYGSITRVVWETYEVIKPMDSIRDGHPILRLFHGTNLSNVVSMFVHNELIASSSGLLGPGVYLGKWNKAYHFGNSTKWAYKYDREKNIGYYDWNSVKNLGVILECDVSIGRTEDPAIGKFPISQEIDTRVGRSGITPTWGGSTLFHDEWCVRNPRRVVVRYIHVMIRTV